MTFNSRAICPRAHRKHSSLVQNQKGQGLIEYLILVALIGVASIAAVKTLNQSVSVQLSNVSKALGAEVQSDIGKSSVSETDWKKKDFRSFMGGSMNKNRGQQSDGDRD